MEADTTALVRELWGQNAPQNVGPVCASARADLAQGRMFAPTSKVIALRPRSEVAETISIGVESWLRNHVDLRCKPATRTSYRYALAKLIEQTGDKLVDDLTQIDVLAALHRLPDASHSTYWCAWSACLRWLGRYDITKGVKRPQSRRRTSIFRTEDMPHWLAGLGMAVEHTWIRRQVLDVLLTLTLTSMRKCEPLGLRWSDCDLGSGVITVNGKTGERTVFVGRIGASILACQPKRTEYVFASRMRGAKLPHLTPQAVNNGMRKVLTRYAARTGYRFPDKLCPHSLRHTFASHAAAAGVPSETIRMLGGWSSEWMRQRYSHLLTEVHADVDKVQSCLVAGLHLQMHVATS